MPTAATAFVQPGDPNERSIWLRQKLIESSGNVSFWAPYTTQGEGGIIQLKTDFMAKRGQNVVLDFDGYIAGTAREGKEIVRGTGTNKPKFYDRLPIQRYRWEVNNGDKFDAANIDAMDLTEHGDSVMKLADQLVRFKDQWATDMLQGFTSIKDEVDTKDFSPSHVISLDATSGIGYDHFVAIENIVQESLFSSASEKAFVNSTWDGVQLKGKPRAPLMPYTMMKGDEMKMDPCWYLFVDNTVVSFLLRNADMQRILQNADVRGKDNRLLKGHIGRVGGIQLVQMPTFFGSSQDNSRRPKDQIIERHGLRKYKAASVDATSKTWQGNSGYATASGDTFSRGILVGQRAVLMAMGLEPQYYYAENSDYGIDSASALEVWMFMKKLRLNPSSGGDYVAAQVARQDFGCIAVDFKIA